MGFKRYELKHPNLIPLKDGMSNECLENQSNLFEWVVFWVDF